MSAGTSIESSVVRRSSVGYILVKMMSCCPCNSGSNRKCGLKCRRVRANARFDTQERSQTTVVPLAIAEFARSIITAVPVRRAISKSESPLVPTANIELSFSASSGKHSRLRCFSCANRAVYFTNFG